MLKKEEFTGEGTLSQVSCKIQYNKAVFYWDQPFQPKPVLADVIEVYQQNAFQPFSVERVENTAIFLGIVGTRLQPC